MIHLMVTMLVLMRMLEPGGRLIYEKISLARPQRDLSPRTYFNTLICIPVQIYSFQNFCMYLRSQLRDVAEWNSID